MDCPPKKRNKEFKRRRQRERQKKTRKITTLHVHHAFLYISLPLLHDYKVKLPNFTSFVEDGNKRQQLLFDFPEFWCSPLEFNSKQICQYLTNLKTRWNFCSRRRCCWVNSLMAGGGAKIRVGAYFIFENGEKNPRFLKKNMGIRVDRGSCSLI